MTVRPSNWTVVLPLKGGPHAKSRLGAPRRLATAIALDCLDAVLAAAPDPVGRVIVVTTDPHLARSATTAGASIRPESSPGDGLPAAIRDGLAGVEGPCAVLLGDLPALRPGDLATALLRATEVLQGNEPGDDASSPAPRSAPNPHPLHTGTRVDDENPVGHGNRVDDRSRVDGEPGRPAMVFVPDAEGTGTVLLAGLEARVLRPAFGAGSAAAHEAAGARRLTLELPRLRRDVDTREDLRTALTLGVGPRTRAVLAELDHLIEA